jgi:flagellar hook-associated protein 1
MGLTGALELGKSALLSYQSALQVVGNNIANAGVDGYARQSPRLSSIEGVPLPEGVMAGGGVALTALQRHMDEALESRLRAANGDEENSKAQQQMLAAVESLYNELSDTDLSSQMSAFFNAFAAVQNTPQDISLRDAAINTGQTLGAQIQHMRSELMSMHDQLNSQISDSVSQANDFAQQVADLNLQIVQAESTGKGAASSLRDQRDGLLKQLSALMDIQTVETPEGAVNVYIGSEPLVQYTRSRGLKTERDLVGDRALTSVHFADDSGSVKINSGQIAGLLTSRDQYVYGQVQQLDSLAANLIRQVNGVHSQGQGLQGFSTVDSSNVLDPTAALSSSAAGLGFAPVSGSFKMTVTTITNAAAVPPQIQSREYDIPVSLPSAGGGTSLNDLASYIAANVAGITATVTSDNRLQLTAGANNTITFGKDTSGALAALGFNSFFTGTDASNIGVEANLAGHPELLAASSNNQPGDGSNAGAIAALADEQKMAPGTQSIPAQWRSVVSALATTSHAAKTASDASHNVSQSLQAQRESVSGVNTDEEAVHLMTYQRSFQAAARYISLVDQLVNEMLSMVK